MTRSLREKKKLKAEEQIGSIKEARLNRHSGDRYLTCGCCSASLVGA